MLIFVVVSIFVFIFVIVFAELGGLSQPLSEHPVFLLKSLLPLYLSTVHTRPTALVGDLDANVNVNIYLLVNIPTALVGWIILMLMLIPPLYLISLDSFFRHQAIVYFGGDTPALARYVDNLHRHLIISLKSLL